MEPELSRGSYIYAGLPFGDVFKINNDEDFNKWASELMDSAMEQAEIPKEQRAQLKQNLLANLASNFKQAYYYGHEPETNYVIKGEATEKVKGCVIAPDDEFKDLYEREYNAKFNDPPKQMRTLSEVEKQFSEAGLGKDLVEFIPLSEQLIERDFLSLVDAKVPEAWQNKV